MNEDMQKLLGELNAAFGKKPKRSPTDNEIARGRNTEWHARNKPLERGGIAARPDPEDSQAWKPIAFITHIFRQTCNTCGNTVEYTGSEHVKFRHVNLHCYVTKGVRDANLFLYPEEAIPDLTEEHFERVSRCPGCIAVERAAEEIWERATQATMQLDLKIDEPEQPKAELLWRNGKQIIGIPEKNPGHRVFEHEWPFTKPELTREELLA